MKDNRTPGTRRVLSKRVVSLALAGIILAGTGGLACPKAVRVFADAAETLDISGYAWTGATEMLSAEEGELPVGSGWEDMSDYAWTGATEMLSAEEGEFPAGSGWETMKEEGTGEEPGEEAAGFVDMEEKEEAAGFADVEEKEEDGSDAPVDDTGESGSVGQTGEADEETAVSDQADLGDTGAAAEPWDIEEDAGADEGLDQADPPDAGLIAEDPGFSEEAGAGATEPAEYADPEPEANDSLSNKDVLEGGTLTAESGNVVVTVVFTEKAGFPKGTRLQVRRVGTRENMYISRLESAQKWIDSQYGREMNEADPEETEGADGLQDGASAAGEADEGEVPDEDPDEGSPLQDKTSGTGTGREETAALPDVERPEISAFALFDISFICDGKEIEPLDAVQVTLKFKEKAFSEQKDLVLIHFAGEAEAEEQAIEAVAGQEVTSGGDGAVEAFFSSDAFSPYAVMALRAGPYIVWFDGTDGMGTGNDMFGRPRSQILGATNVSQTVTTDTVTLPMTAGTNSKYRVNGWYDVTNGAYYKPGDSAPVSGNTVFYAEWVLADYNLGPAANVVSGQPDISSFVRTDVFDYNELINIYHGAEISSSSISAQGHTERWRDSRDTSQGNDFLFTNWYNQNFGETYLAFPSNLVSGRNRYAGAGDLTTGIVSSEEDPMMEDLFGLSDAPGKLYLGQGDMLYQYDGNESSSRYGYYYYDSDKNAADYNQAQERFYVYTSPQTIRGQWNDQGRNVPGFMPFEEGTATINQKTGQVDFWFGMVSTVNFFLPDNPGTNGNKAAGGKDMEFYFSGDDDVWVFVDGELLLDLGGIHREINGSINFSDGNIYVEGNVVGTIPDSIRSGDHELRFYYLERGSSWSNASIYFNIAPRYSLELVKRDADDQNLYLQGAVFQVFLDEDCTIPASVWESMQAYENGDPAVNSFTTGEDGRASCYGLYSNRTYYLKEVSSPPGYPAISDRVIALQLDATGRATIGSGSDFASLTQDDATKKIDLSVVNELPETIDVPVEKHWYKEDGSQFDASETEAIEVELYRAEIEASSGGTDPQEPGGNTGAVLPVNIRTQFFNSGNGNGSNADTSAITSGNLTANAVVTSGGSLTLNIDVTADAAGIYSVTANGHPLQPMSASGSTSTNCMIGGRWGNYPPLHASYVIDPVTEALDIRVTLIGYLEYGGDPWHADTAYSMAVTASSTEPPASPEPDPGQEPGGGLEIPSSLPEDAVYVASLTLSASNDWRDVFTELPARSEDGTMIYVYYVKEIHPDGYSTSYLGNGSMGGTVSIYNVRLRELTLKKIWLDGDGNPLADDLPESITLKLTQFDDTEGSSRDITVTLTASEGWTRKWRSDSSELAEEEGHSYRYRIKEVNIDSGYQVSYSDNNAAGVSEGIITATNRKKVYSVDFIKADSVDHDRRLAGAVFCLYTDPACTEDSLVEAYASQEEGAEKTSEFISGENGDFSIYGLSPGTYYMKEISAPEGYYLIEELLEVTVTDAAGGLSGVRTVRLIDGVVTEAADAPQRIEIVMGSLIQVFIYNSPLYMLPSTGGPGDYLFTISGFAIMSAILLLYIRSRRGKGIL